MEEYLFFYDICEKKVINNCTLYPTQLEQSHFPWLYARNNKYGDEMSIDSDKIGKWMIFFSKDRVNSVWDQIKTAVTNGDLWNSKVSTTNLEKVTHAIMIYTKDYTDLDDVISVLEFLESSGIKPPGVNLKYKTDVQTRAGIYRGGKQKPWIYSSDTIRRKSTGTQRTLHNYLGPSSSTKKNESIPPSELNWRERPTTDCVRKNGPTGS